MMILPATSIVSTSEESRTVRASPTALIFPSWTSRIPCSIGCPEIGIIRAFIKAVGFDCASSVQAASKTIAAHRQSCFIKKTLVLKDLVTRSVEINCNESKWLSSDRQSNHEGRTTVLVLLQFEAAAVRRHDAVTDRQAESCTFAGGLRGEERVENLFGAVGLDPRSRVADFDDDLGPEQESRNFELATI